MKKINLVFFILLFTTYFNFNIYANEQSIYVGLSKYKNLNNIVLDNKNINIGYNNNSSFNSDAILNTNYKFTIKPLNIYSIKIDNIFYSYQQALDFSKSYNNSYIFKDKNWYVMVGFFDNMLDANSFIQNQKINGQIIKLQDTIGIYNNDELIIGYKDKLTIKSNESISLENKKYRNFVDIICKNNLLTVINVLDIEEYLYGVVPSEMPSSWHKEALKAQAVACRNYAYSNLNIHKNEGFDVCDTTHCQVYNGILDEKPSTTEAVNETKNIFAYYNNEKINAVYSSSSGGYTDDSENVWNTKTPYLRAIKDEYEEGYKKWTRTFTFNELSSALSIGSINEVILESSPITGRASSLTFLGSNGQKVLKKEDIRTFFSKFKGGSLESRNFKMATSNKTDHNDISKNISKDNTFYAISSKGNNVIDKNNLFLIGKNGNYNQFKNIFVVDKTQNTQSLNIKNNTILNDENYVQKINIKDSPSVTFIGKGWGHGVGMSQYGANSLAKKGYKYDQILKYYYTDIEVK